MGTARSGTMVPRDFWDAMACFDLVGYEQLIDYALPAPPPPELSPEDATWIDATVRAAGQRP